MIKHFVLPILLIVLLPIILKLLIKLRCGIAIGYIVLANTLLRDWANNNTWLSDVILFAILTVTMLSWGMTIYKKISEHYGFSTAVRQNEKLLATQLNAARSAGVPTGNLIINSAAGLPIVKY